MRRLLLGLASLSVACAQETLTGQVPQTLPPPVVAPLPTAPEPLPAVDVNYGNRTHGELMPPEVTPEESFRQRRRLDLDQLSQSIQKVTGGIGWTERRGSVDVDLFAELAPTLGKPDFLQITEEDLAPTAMFQKFLDDAARSVCGRWLDVDFARPEAERTFFVAMTPTTRYAEAPEAVEANLRALLLSFHGRKVAAGAPELQPWLWLVQSAEHVSAEQRQVWQTLCVGLFTHPDFFTY